MPGRDILVLGRNFLLVLKDLFGKIKGTVRTDFENEAIFNNTNWGFLERETEVPFSFLSPPDPTPDGIFESVQIL